MDEKEIKEQLEKIAIPEPDESTKKRAIGAAMAVFHEEQQKTQGSGFSARLMNKITSEFDILFRRRAMRKSQFATGMFIIGAGAVLLSTSYLVSKHEPPQQPPEKMVQTIDKSDSKKPDLSQVVGGETGASDEELPASSYEANKPVEIQEMVAEEEADVADIQTTLSTPPSAPPPPTMGRGSTATGISDSLSNSVGGLFAYDKRSRVDAPVLSKNEAKEMQLGQRQIMSQAFIGNKKEQTVNRMIVADDITPQPHYKDVGRDKFEEIEINPIKLVEEEPVSTFSIDVDTTSYSFARRALNEGVLPQKNSVRVEELINYFDYDYELPDSKAEPFKPTVAVYPTPWNSDTQLLHIGIKGHDIVPKDKPRSNLVFLLDVSGSMNSPDKLPLLKNSFRLLVDELDQEDTVGIVVYAGAAGTVLEPTKVSEKSKILGALDKLKSGGSTAGGEGIRQAYALAESSFDEGSVNRVILATDGDFNVGITNSEELKGFIERKRKTGIFLSVLGFGQGNYNDALMQALAQNGNGNAAYIDTLNEARKVLVDEASSTLYPIAKDVKIQIEFNPEKVAEYRLIGYETRLLKREDFNNDKIDAGDIGSGHAVTAIYEITAPDSKARLVDDLRYKSVEKEITKPDTNEFAFLKIRYKLPDSDTSTLITRPIMDSDAYEDIDDADKEIRFAAAVAAYGQLLRDDPFTKDYDFDDVRKLAKSAQGDDPFGYRGEFINLLHLAKSARDLRSNN